MIPVWKKSSYFFLVHLVEFIYAKFFLNIILCQMINDLYTNGNCAHCSHAKYKQ